MLQFLARRALVILSVFIISMNLSCRYDGGDYYDCMTILDCDDGFSCIDGECVFDPKGNGENKKDDNSELPVNDEEESEIEEEDEIEETVDEEEIDEEEENPDSNNNGGGGNPFEEVFCTDEIDCDENSVCYKEDNKAECVDPFKKYWKVTIDTLCLSNKKPNGDNWDSGIVGAIDQPDPYAILFINGKEALRTPYADESKCAHWNNHTNVKFQSDDQVYIEMWEYDSMIFNDDDFVGTHEWTEGIPVEIFKAREFIFDNPSNPGFVYLRVTFVEMD
jgi:hypothetical protein